MSNRIGRTARAGQGGIAVAFCDGSERPALRAIERMTGMALTPVGEVPPESRSRPAGAPGGDRQAQKNRRPRRWSNGPARAAA